MAADPNKVYWLMTDGEAGLISDADTDIGFERVRRCYDRDFKRVSIILFASATISSLRLFSRLVGLSGSAEAEPPV